VLRESRVLVRDVLVKRTSPLISTPPALGRGQSFNERSEQREKDDLVTGRRRRRELRAQGSSFQQHPRKKEKIAAVTRHRLWGGNGWHRGLPFLVNSGPVSD